MQSLNLHCISKFQLMVANFISSYGSLNLLTEALAQ